MAEQAIQAISLPQAFYWMSKTPQFHALYSSICHKAPVYFQAQSMCKIRSGYRLDYLIHTMEMARWVDVQGYDQAHVCNNTVFVPYRAFPQSSTPRNVSLNSSRAFL